VDSSSSEYPEEDVEEWCARLGRRKGVRGGDALGWCMSWEDGAKGSNSSSESLESVVVAAFGVRVGALRRESRWNGIYLLCDRLGPAAVDESEGEKRVRMLRLVSLQQSLPRNGNMFPSPK
jgi:hypothetical protein